jgi:hypothetical protein
MSTSMSSDPIITRESERCQRKPFLKLWVWARESQLPISAFFYRARVRRKPGGHVQRLNRTRAEHRACPSRIRENARPIKH